MSDIVFDTTKGRGRTVSRVRDYVEAVNGGGSIKKVLREILQNLQ